MKNFRNITIFFLLLAALSFKTDNITENPDYIANSIKSGNAVSLSKYFNDNIKLIVMDKEYFCSKEQAVQILNDFFTKNKVLSYEVLHKSEKENIQYFIGNLQTSSGGFKVYYFIKTNNLIHQFRIEKY